MIIRLIIAIILITKFRFNQYFIIGINFKIATKSFVVKNNFIIIKANLCCSFANYIIITYFITIHNFLK
jgi:hypothetical protein